MKTKRKLLGIFLFVLVAVLSFGISTTAQAKKKTTKKKTTKTKTVKKVSLSKATIKLSKTSYTYNGKAKKPTVTVKYKKKKINKSKNYTVKYTKNKSAGTAKVTIKAKKKSKLYKGKKTKTFKIKKASRTLVADRAEYTAVEGDGAFNVVAKPSKGTGTVTYSCATTNVIKVDTTGVVTVVAQGSATVNMSIPATTNYKAASTTTKVTISKKTITVDSEASIRNFDYETQKANLRNETIKTSLFIAAASHQTCPLNKLTEFQWNVLNQFTIPGLAPTAENDLTNKYIQCNNLCPQGFCFAGDYLLTTAYCADNLNTHNSCIFIYNKSTGAYLRTIVLSLKTHVGGITYDDVNQNIWICHAGSMQLQKITYNELKKYASGAKGMVNIDTVKLSSVNGTPSAIAYNKNDGYIWIAKNVTVPNHTTSNKPYMWAYMYVKGEDGEEDQLIPAQNAIPQADSPAEGYLGVKVANASDVSPLPTTDPMQPVTSSAISTLKTTDVTETAAPTASPAEETSAGVVVTVVTSKGKAITDATVTELDVQTNKTKSSDSADEEEEEEEEERITYYPLQVGDIITSLGGKEISTVADLNKVLKGCKENQKISISIERTITVEDEDTTEQTGTDSTEKKTKRVEISGKVTLGLYEVIEYLPEIEIPNRVQGITFSEDGKKLLLSRSTGRNTEKKNYISEVVVYDWKETDTELGQPAQSIVIPPMVEQIDVKDNKLYMIFESAATLYLEGTDGNGKSESPIDKLVSIPFK